MEWANIHLNSTVKLPDFEDDRVRTSLMADIEENRISFDTRTEWDTDHIHLQAVFSDWDTVTDLYDFIAHHLQRDTDVVRSTTIPLQDGYFYISHVDRESEVEDLEQMEVLGESDRIVFRGPGPQGPFVRFFEEKRSDGSQDLRNATKLLDFLGEITDEKLIDSPTHALSEFNNLDQELVATGLLELIEMSHYQSAINDAFKVLEERVREKARYGRDKYGTSLMEEAFSTDGGPLSVGDTESEKLGQLRLYAGTIQALRNPSSHHSLEGLDRQMAHDIISLVNLLLRLIELNEDE